MNTQTIYIYIYTYTLIQTVNYDIILVNNTICTF